LETVDGKRSWRKTFSHHLMRRETEGKIRVGENISGVNRVYLVTSAEKRACNLHKPELKVCRASAHLDLIAGLESRDCFYVLQIELECRL
jgi:hypothetical protein